LSVKGFKVRQTLNHHAGIKSCPTIFINPFRQDERRKKMLLVVKFNRMVEKEVQDALNLDLEESDARIIEHWGDAVVLQVPQEIPDEDFITTNGDDPTQYWHCVVDEYIHCCCHPHDSDLPEIDAVYHLGEYFATDFYEKDPL
jgi:hypothetical protein